MRLNIFDGFRGHLLIGMLVAHLSFEQALSYLKYFHHHAVIKMYDGEFFVFIAGMLVGWLWVNKYVTVEKRRKFLKNRLWTIYKYYILSALPYLGYSILSGENPILTIFNIGILQDGGLYSDILPIYFFCFLLLAPLAFFYALDKPTVFVAISFLIYVFAQLTDLNGFFGWSERMVVFDIAAWQFLFFLSVVVGRNSEKIVALIQGIDEKTALIIMAALVVLSIIPKSDVFYPDLAILTANSTSGSHRLELQPVYLLRIIMAILIMAFIMLRHDRLLKPIKSFFQWYFTLPFLRNIGSYSIQMFVFHVYLMAIYKLYLIDFSQTTKVLYSVVSIIVFILAPNIHVWRKKTKKQLEKASHANVILGE